MNKHFSAFCYFQMNVKCCVPKLVLSSLFLGLISVVCMKEVCASIPFATSQPSSNATKASIIQKLLGEWLGQEASPYSSSVVQTLVFAPDNTAYLLREHDTGTTAMKFGYELDSTAQPMQLNLLIAGESTRTIFDFTPDDRLRLELSGLLAGDPRPSAFSANADLLQKVSDAISLVPEPDIVSQQVKAVRAPEAEGILYISLINRSLQAFYLKNGKFTASMTELGLDIRAETENYRYQIVPEGSTNKEAKIFGRAKRSGLRSLMGAVFKIQWEERYDAVLGIICQTYKPSLFAPAPPFLVGNTDTYAPRCGSGSQPVSQLKRL